MRNREVQSVVTRCLLDPAFLARLAADRDAVLDGLGLGGEASARLAGLDLARVRLFSGFVLAVKHNDLWDRFPNTRGLLRRFRIELEVFSAYRDAGGARHVDRSAGRPAQIACFLDFLDWYLAAQPETRLAVLRDVARHERLVWEIDRELAAACEDVPLSAAVEPAEEVAAAELIPRPRGSLRLACFEHDPLALMERLAAGDPMSAGCERRRRWLAYLVDRESRTLRLLELDEATAALMAAIDGRRTLGEVVREVIGDDAGLTAEVAVSLLDALQGLEAFFFVPSGAAAPYLR